MNTNNTQAARIARADLTPKGGMEVMRQAEKSESGWVMASLPAATIPGPRTFVLVVDGIDTDIHLRLNPDGTWGMSAPVEI